MNTQFIRPTIFKIDINFFSPEKIHICENKFSCFQKKKTKTKNEKQKPTQIPGGKGRIPCILTAELLHDRSDPSKFMT